jgi:hypothetical protein
MKLENLIEEVDIECESLETIEEISGFESKGSLYQNR